MSVQALRGGVIFVLALAVVFLRPWRPLRAAPLSIRTVTGDSVEEAMPRRGWHVPSSFPRELPGKGSTDPNGPPSWAGPTSLRCIWGVASGRQVAEDGIRGWLLRVPTGGSLLVTGFHRPPPTGRAVVLRGPWTPHPNFAWGVLWNARVATWASRPLADLEPATLAPDAVAEMGSWRKLLSSGKGFVDLRGQPVASPLGAEPATEIDVEAWRYDGKASTALATLARNRLRHHLRRASLRRRSSSMGAGARPPALTLHRVGHVSGWTTALVAAEAPRPQAWLWAVGGPWIVVFQGRDPVLLDVMGRALLGQPSWRPVRP